MSQSSNALIVVDVQQSFPNRHYFQEKYMPPFMAHVQKLIDGAAERNVPVVQILHVEPEGAFSKASGHVRTLDGISIKPDTTIEKFMHSAFASTILDVWLKERGINKITICGIRTEQCCETTTRHASDLGYKVNFVTDATLTFDMQHPDGSTLTADQIKHRTETVLVDRFASILTVDEALADFGA
jgi:nicotinamidase-related amidase